MNRVWVLLGEIFGWLLARFLLGGFWGAGFVLVLWLMGNLSIEVSF